MHRVMADSFRDAARLMLKQSAPNSKIRKTNPKLAAFVNLQALRGTRYAVAVTPHIHLV